MTGSDKELRAQACRILASMREATSDCLGSDFAFTPRLDMLTQLYLAECEHRALHAWSLCLTSQVPASTAHRKVGELERDGLVLCRRGASPENEAQRNRRQRDHRYVRVSLTQEGRAKIVRLLDRFVNIWGGDCPSDGADMSA
ncbi:MarR family transcriptional regulator [Sphingobium sp. BHU LFT2]|uniref:MarR family transcriptional regulator n=1 Tax=Sphingobium sp. BHU LFT2 TaxID=2807634 RepID=UPI001BE85047|nr:MarR family transcriptional regulator [Sphingobium sp. BHU LFT2]MBT2243608.1 MarR family transcriptional regulator [Sphingobium sp. BHU LFT2]